MITISNYSESTKAVDFSKLSKVLQDGDKFVKEFAEFYNDDADIKKAIDNHIKLLSESLKSNSTLPKPEATKKSKPEIRKSLQQKIDSIKNDTFPENHPLMILDQTSPQFEKAINEYLAERKLKSKQRKPKYKIGDKLSWRDNDDKLMSEKIADIGFTTTGEPIYTVTGNRSNPTWKYSESEITEAIKKKTMYLNQLAPLEVHHIEPEVKFIKRYAALHGKVKTNDELVNLLHSLQKAINDKTITKLSKYADEIMTIQNSLIKAVNAGGSIKVEIDEDSLLKYQAIATGQKVIYSIPVIKQFIMLSGKSGIKEKAEKLLERIQEGVTKQLFKTDPYSNQIKAMKTALEDYITGKQSKLLLADISLRGLYGLAGIEPPKVNLTPSSVMSTSEFVDIPIKTLQLHGDWARLIGKPSDPFKIMFYGGPGCGKSSLAVKFAKYLATYLDHKVLMVSKEEGFVHTLQEKLIRLKASHPNFEVTGEIPADMSKYTTIILDSVNTLGLTADQLKELYSKYPKKNFVLIFQVTKEGKFRGEQEYEHDVDASFHCDKLIAYQTSKNRFGGKESIKIV